MQHLLERELKKNYTQHVLLGVQSDRVDFVGAVGNASADAPYFIASVTKMYTTTCLMQLVDEGRLDLDAPITSYLPAALTSGIHVHKGTDYSAQLKVYQLIHQTSGLADYFQDRGADGKSLVDRLVDGEDPAFSVTDVVSMVRAMQPKFAPDASHGHKSHYSDTNYQLLGAIIENITEKTLATNYQTRIFDRLDLSHTYLYDGSQTNPLPIYYKDEVLAIPQTMASFGPDGGIVSTVAESLRFLRGYFDGELFDKAHFERMMDNWNLVFFPVQYGYGLMRFQLPRVMTLFRYSPELIGHAGASGSFAFFAPRERLYIAGTFNQIDRPSRPFAFMLKVIADS